MLEIATHQLRLSAVRQTMTEQGVDAFIQPRGDEYLGEYVPAHNERLLWLTGFTGSAGMAVVMAARAAIFVDGRYTLQVRQQVPQSLFDFCSLTAEPLAAWLVANLPAGSQVGYDPRNHAFSWVNELDVSLEKRGLSLVAMTNNPVDENWRDRPAPTQAPMSAFDDTYAGASSAVKRRQIGELIAAEGADLALISALDSIAWLLNIRGRDIPCLPIVLGTALLQANGDMVFFTDLDKCVDGLMDHIGAGVTFRPQQELQGALAALTGKKLLADGQHSNAWCLQQAISAGAQLIEGYDPVALAKAAKNPVELEGFRRAHIRDAVAVCRFLAWLDREVAADHFHNEAVLSDKLLSFRQDLPEFVEPSFDTISAVAGNAAMCHYSHLNGEPAQMPANSIYLVDSGAHYPDGTTDITRTVAIGEVSSEVKRMVTLVLKGHIALGSARFPKGTTGTQLDALARQFLWAEGFDYDHGTGHGVGHFLSVHEGPQRISKASNSVALTPGMVCSNEPGYYRDDAFGIRLENLVAVRPCAALVGAEREIYEFEVLTWVPMDTRLFDRSLLTQAEIEWVNCYHQQVHEILSPRLSGDDLAWLQKATAAL